MLPFFLRRARQVVKSEVHEAAVFDGIISSIEEIVDKGYKWGIVTSNASGVVRAYIRDNGFPECQFIASTPGLFGKDKALLRMAKKHRFDPANTWYVGDEPRDVSAAKKAGMKSAGAAWGFVGAERLKQEGADVVVPKVSSLVESLGI